MDIEPAASSSIEVFDGYDAMSKRIGSYDVVNGSFPMGVTTTFNYVFIKFSWKLPSVCPSLKVCVKFTMIIDTYKGQISFGGLCVLSGCLNIHVFVSWKLCRICSSLVVLLKAVINNYLRQAFCYNFDF